MTVNTDELVALKRHDELKYKNTRTRYNPKL